MVKKNKLKTFLLHIENHLYIFKKIKGLVGITLNGGLARDYADHLSEIDLTIFLEDETYKKWEKGESEICCGICIYDNMIYDIKYINYKEEFDRNLSPIVELWDLSYAKILYDPYGKIKTFFSKKLSEKYDIKIICSLMFEIWWYYRLAGDIWIYREDPLQGHMLLNEAVKGILKSIFIANKLYVPHDKWLVNYCKNLKWMPNKWDEVKKQILSTGDLSINSLIERQKIIDKVWNEINFYVREEYFDGAPSDITTKYFYDLIKLIKNKKKISVDDWIKVFPLKILNEDPFHKFLVKKGNWICFDEAAFNGLSADSMYYWHYKAVKELQ